MSAAEILIIILQVSIFISVLSYGMQSSTDDFLYLFRRPGMLLRALVSMNVVMPVFAGIMVAIFPLQPVIKIALVALACSPVPPILPTKALKSGGTRSFTFGLLAAASLLSLVIIPVTFRIFIAVFQPESHFFSELTVLKTILVSVILPLVIGIVIRRFAPAFSEKYAVLLRRIGLVLMIVAFLPVLIAMLSTIWSLIGNGTILVFIAFALVGVTSGHFLGGPDPANRAVLALATASRHPAIAIALTAANVAGEEPKAAASAVLLYLLVSGIIIGPYLNWLGTSDAEKEVVSEA